MKDLIDTKLASRRDPVWLFGTFSGIALILAVIGIYGGALLLCASTQIRDWHTYRARGTEHRYPQTDSGHAVKLIIAGMAVGLAVSFGIVRALSSLLFGVQPTDLATFLGVCALQAVLALIACGIPALRATRMDPSTVLRNE
jgi:Zn-dependent protease